MKKKVGIVICSRRYSSRLPEKAFARLQGIPILQHLINNLKLTNIPIYLAVPHGEFGYYESEGFARDATIITGDPDSPLARMAEVARDFSLDIVIRVTHDKVLVDSKYILKALKDFPQDDPLAYLVTPDLPSGCGFEIIHGSLLARADDAFSGVLVEHISYALRACNPIVYSYFCNAFPKKIVEQRFLIDYDSDLSFMRMLLKRTEVTLDAAVYELKKRPWLSKLNKLPDVTIYTCVYNGADTIDRCIESVFSQDVRGIEYIIVDDGSTDDTVDRIIKSRHWGKFKFFQNGDNLGLASSSNRALKLAKGKYLVRLDADDFFVHPSAVSRMLKTIGNNDVIYPSYYCERSDAVMHGQLRHHVGGAMFLKSALDYCNFTDGLRHYEGLDLYQRSAHVFKKIYFEEPIFWYTARANSLSASTTQARREIQNKLERGINGARLAN